MGSREASISRVIIACTSTYLYSNHWVVSMKLFISYSRDDKQWVYEFARRLSKLRARHDVWFDQDLHVSQKWWDEILNQIERCEVTIVILTPITGWPA